MNDRFVLYIEDRGIFLGECLGFGFWTKLDAVGQPEAITFSSEAQIQEYLAQWVEPIKVEWKAVPIKTAGPLYATIEECVQAGLPAWNPDDHI